MHYTEIVEAINKSSMTQAPALLSVAIENAFEKKAFNGGAAIISMVCQIIARKRPYEEPTPRFAYSTDGEKYYGGFDTREKAIEEAKSHYKSFWVGQCVQPTQPEDFWSTEDWLEHVSCQDEYSGDWCEDWEQSTKEQRNQLEHFVQHLLQFWLDHHGLRPQFYSVSGEQQYQVQGDAVQVV